MIEKTASFIGSNDEGPNIKLALELISSKNADGIREIAGGLNNPNQSIAHACIKVLYEIGEREPSLISPFVLDFIRQLKSRNNRLVWGAMTALSKIAALEPHTIYNNLDSVIKAYQGGSVITIDNSISVFAELVNAAPEYESKIFPLIIKHLETCRPKEVGQHAERAFVCVNGKNAFMFKQILQKRYDSLTDAQKKRVNKLLNKIDQGLFA